jgi:hypothetical protein
LTTADKIHRATCQTSFPWGIKGRRIPNNEIAVDKSNSENKEIYENIHHFAYIDKRYMESNRWTEVQNR